jgi:hypothetical protein
VPVGPFSRFVEGATLAPVLRRTRSRRRVAVLVVAFLALAGVTAFDGGTGMDTSHGAGGAPPEPPAKVPRSDSFGGRWLHRSWSILQPNLVQPTVRRGALSLELTGPALWFNNSMGVLVFKPVAGNFKVTATVRTRSVSSSRQSPAPAIRLGGLMARDPASDSTGVQSYVHIVAGNGPSGVLAIEHKTTANSESVYEAPEWPSGDAQLRICRVGSAFHLYKRIVGSKAWQLAASYDRPDMAATLQVGADIYSPNTPPDLRVSWDEIAFQPVKSTSACTRG